MCKEPNTVTSNVVKGLMDFSEEDTQLELNSSDFHDELNSTVLVGERVKRSKLEQLFSKKSGKVRQRILSSSCQNRQAPQKLCPKEMWRWPQKQRQRNKKQEKKSNFSQKDEQPKKKPSKKRNQQVSGIAFDFEKKTRIPPLVEISSTSTEEGEENEAEVKQETEKDNNSGR